MYSYSRARYDALDTGYQSGPITLYIPYVDKICCVFKAYISVQLPIAVLIVCGELKRITVPFASRVL